MTPPKITIKLYGKDGRKIAHTDIEFERPTRLSAVEIHAELVRRAEEMVGRNPTIPRMRGLTAQPLDLEDPAVKRLIDETDVKTQTFEDRGFSLDKKP